MKYDRRKFIASVGLGLGAMKLAGAEALKGNPPGETKPPAPNGLKSGKNPTQKAGAAPAHHVSIPACAWKHSLGDTPRLPMPELTPKSN